MKTRLLRKLRKEAKNKIYIVFDKTYNVVRSETATVCASLEGAKKTLMHYRREYILNIVINKKLRKL